MMLTLTNGTNRKGIAKTETTPGEPAAMLEDSLCITSKSENKAHT